MKIEVSETTTTTTKKIVDIELPYYAKSGDRFIKLEAEDKLLVVENSKWITSIVEYRELFQNLPFERDAVEVTEKEFKDVYNSAIKKLKL